MPTRQTLTDAERLRSAIGHFVRRARTLDTMPSGQAAALGHVVRDGALSIADLADRGRVVHQSMARTVKLLADQSLVELAPDPHDGRRVLVSATPEGKAQLTRARRGRAGWIARAIDSELDDDERALIVRAADIIEKLTRHDVD